MTKICPSCQATYDDNQAFCSQCGSRLVDQPDNPNPTLHLGDANAISGGISINQSKNISSHDVHYHSTQERTKSDRELEQERRSQYREAVTKWMRNGAVTVEARIRLDDLRVSLGVDSEVAKQIETAVKKEQTVRTSGDALSVIAKMALKNAVMAVESNSPQASDHIKKLASVCRTTTNEQVHYYYYMLLAAFEASHCVEAYEHRAADSYWQSFWTSLAYRKLGNEMEAEALLNEMSALWPDRTETDVIVNACVGLILSSQGDLDGCRDTIVEFLNQATDEPSELLNDMFHALLHQVGMEEADNDRFAFYVEQFFVGSGDLAGNYEEEKKMADEADDRKDYATALKIYRKWAERGEANAWNSLGWMYENGHGVPQSFSEAMKCYRKSAEQGYFKAQRNIGWLYYNGNGVPTDHSEAIKWWRKAADQGDSRAQQLMGSVYYDGDGVSQDYLEAAKWYRKSADQGDADAQNSLGDIYYWGLGVSQNHPEALKWYLKSAEQGNAEAQCQVGFLYFEGEGVPQNYTEGIKWLKKAVEQGSAMGMARMGAAYEEGTGVPQNDAEAVKWFLKAEEAGLDNPVIQCCLGRHYENGTGVAKDYAEARKWYQKSADQDFEEAKEALNAMAFSGKSNVSVSMDDAAEELKEAEEEYGKDDEYAYHCFSENLPMFIWLKWAERGNATAQYMLGMRYLQYGFDGCIMDSAEANKWLQKAADQGDNKAIKALKETKNKKMDPAEKALFEKEMKEADEAFKRKDYKQAFDFCEKWSKRGDATASYKFGRFIEECNENDDYRYGDDRTVLKWYQKAACEGNAEAQYHVGFFNDQEYQYEHDSEYKELAFGWYCRAAEQGQPDAIEWCQKVAEKGERRIQFHLGLMYYFGRGVEMSRLGSHRWFKKAADQGYKPAIRVLEIIQKNN